MKNSSSGNSVTARKGPGASSMSALNTEPNSEPSLPDPDIADEGSGLNEHFSRAALEEYAQAWRDFEAVQVDAPLPPDSIAVNLMRLAGLDKHKARECEEIVRVILADRRQRAETKGTLSARSGARDSDVHVDGVLGTYKDVTEVKHG